MERKREKMNRHNDRVQGLRTSVNDLKENKLIIENDLQKRITLEETKASLAEQCLTLQNEVDVSEIVQMFLFYIPASRSQI